MAETFAELFNDLPKVTATAPGTITLLGSHTDYSHGLLLAMAIPLQTTIEIAESRDDNYHFYLPGGGQMVTCSLEGDIPDGFAGSLFGVVMVLKEHGFQVPPVSALVKDHVPFDAGLGGNAALQVAMMRAVRRLFQAGLNDVTLGRLAHRAESEYTGLNSGLMGQMAASLARQEEMLFLDARSLERQFLPLPEGAELLVMDSGIVETGAAGAFSQRRGECVEACRRLQVAALRDVTDVAQLADLHPLLQRRARHVVTENAWVTEAAAGVSARRLGQLLNESHASLRDDYEVSIPQVDLLVQLLQSDPRTFGARLAGSGCGGSCVAIVEMGAAAAVANETLARYGEKGGRGRIVVPTEGGGMAG